MRKRSIIILIFIFLIVEAQVFSQGAGTIIGRILDNTTGAPVPFATIKLTGPGYLTGVISNPDGSFQIPSGFRNLIDTLTISCIGYVTRKIPLNQLSIEKVNIFHLKVSVLRLSEVVVSARRINHFSARKIVKMAIDRIPLNYPDSTNVYIGYYRDYQIKDQQYINLNEAIVAIIDSGFNTNDQLDTKVGLLAYRKSIDFPRDTLTASKYDNDKGNKFIPGAYLYPFGGNELTIWRIHDPIRNYRQFSYSFVNNLSRNFIPNHIFTLKDTVLLDDMPLYHITFHTRNDVTGNDYTAKGDLYIDLGNYAIHKLTYSTFMRKNDSLHLLFNINVEYAGSGGAMHLNYISFNNFFNIRNPDDFKVQDITFDLNQNAFVLTFNHNTDTHTANIKENYNFRYNGRKLQFDRIVIPAKHTNRVYLFLKPGVLPDDSLSEMIPKVSAGITGVTDTAGRVVNKITYKSIHQFRELFVEKVLKHPITGSMPVVWINKNESLGKFMTNHIIPADISNFWMNTPLKER